MRVDRLYFPNIGNLHIDDKNIVNKIKNVLRKRQGDELIIFDGKGTEYKVCIAKLDKRSIQLDSLEQVTTQEKAAIQIHLAFSLIKSQKVDIILQKCVELGVDEFYPFISDYSNMKEPGQSKVQHFEHVIEEATAQSRRLWLAKFNEVKNTASLEDNFASYDLIILADPYDTQELKSQLKALSKGKVLFLVGPEGGFSPDECKRFSSYPNLIKYKFSNFILRSETAAIVLTAQIANIIDKKS